MKRVMCLYSGFDPNFLQQLIDHHSYFRRPFHSVSISMNSSAVIIPVRFFDDIALSVIIRMQIPGTVGFVLNIQAFEKLVKLNVHI